MPHHALLLLTPVNSFTTISIPTVFTMFPSSALRNEQFQFDLENNPYKAKKIWPPDFSKLSPKYQFRLEKRYRRRAKLAWARPRWTKFTKLAQYGLSICVLIMLVSLQDDTDLLSSSSGLSSVLLRLWEGPREATIPECTFSATILAIFDRSDHILDPKMVHGSCGFHLDSQHPSPRAKSLASKGELGLI